MKGINWKSFAWILGALLLCIPPAWAGESVTVKNVKPMGVLGIKAESSVDKISATMGPLYDDLYNYLGKKGIAPAGPPLSVWYTPLGEAYMPGQAIKYEVCVPVAKKMPGSGKIQYQVLPGSKMARLIHKGHWDKLEFSQDKMMAWMKKKGVAPSGPRYEIYLTNPKKTKPADYKTEILIPFAKN